jgi:hypothetical protein
VRVRCPGNGRAWWNARPGPLEGEAEVLVEAEDSQQYAFRILHAGTLLAEGRAAVMLRRGDDAD